METEIKFKLTPVFVALDSAIKIWWKNLSKFIMIYIWGILYVIIPVAVFFGLMSFGSFTGLNSNLIFRIIFIFIGFLTILFLFYYFFRLTISFFLLIKHDYIGRELNIYRESAHYFWSYLFLKILIGVIILLWFLILVIPVILTSIVPTTLVIIFYFLALIPAIIFIVFYSLAIYVFFFEGKKGMKAIKRSRQLIKNYWWSIAGRILFITIVILLLEFILTRPLAYLPIGGIWAIIWNILINIVFYLIIPLVILFFYNIYQNLLKIKK